MLRPRFNDREARLLLAALYVYRQREFPSRDSEVQRLYEKVERMADAFEHSGGGSALLTSGATHGESFTPSDHPGPKEGGGG